MRQSVSYPSLCETTPARSANTDAARAFRHELGLCLPALRLRARQLCRNRSDAEDLLQDTAVRALRFETTFEVGTNLRAWLHQILFSVFVTRCRRGQRERRALKTLSIDPLAWPRPTDAQASTSLSPPVERALAQIPQKFAQVVRLVDIEQHAYKDAAREVGVPVGTVMSRLFRGRRLLAQMLMDDATPLAA